jgi:hypothetical protein
VPTEKAASQLVAESAGVAGSAIVGEPLPKIPTLLVISTCSVYVPAQTSMLEPELAALTAA